MSDFPPPLDANPGGLEKETLAGRVELLKQREAADQAELAAEAQAELDTKTEFHKSMLEVAKGTIERAHTGSTALATAAATVVTLYTGLLGVTFAAADRPLPPRGVVPALLLGTALVFAAGYKAYLSQGAGRAVDAPKPSASRRANEYARARFFVSWTRAAATRRGGWLRGSVLAFGFAVMFLPAPFVSIGRVDLGPVAIGAETPATAAAKAPWPPVPRGRAGDIQLQKLRYAAELEEAAAARSGGGAAGKDGNDGLWFILGALALVASAVPVARDLRANRTAPA